MGAEQAVPKTVFTHFYQALHRRDHHSWPITGFEDTDDPKRREPNAYWWKQELEYVARASIDVLALMYWAPRAVDPDGGLIGWHRLLDTARLRQDEGHLVPKISCHYDGMGFGDLKGLDLGSDEGIDRVFHHMAQWYDFWTQPERAEHLFMFRGADVCFMYRPEALGACTCPPGGAFVDGLHRRFADRYPGRRLYLVLDMLWTWTYDTNELHAENADNYYLWGASGGGPTLPRPGANRFPDTIRPEFGVQSVGPGFYDVGHDQSETPNSEIGRRYRDRRGGQTFREELELAISRRDEAPWLLLECWNLFLERSEITVSNKCGDTCVNLCSELLPRFRQP